MPALSKWIYITKYHLRVCVLLIGSSHDPKRQTFITVGRMLSWTRMGLPLSMYQNTERSLYALYQPNGLSVTDWGEDANVLSRESKTSLSISVLLIFLFFCKPRNNTCALSVLRSHFFPKNVCMPNENAKSPPSLLFCLLKSFLQLKEVLFSYGVIHLNMH